MRLKKQSNNTDTEPQNKPKYKNRAGKHDVFPPQNSIVLYGLEKPIVCRSKPERYPDLIPSPQNSQLACLEKNRIYVFFCLLDFGYVFFFRRATFLSR